MERAAVQDMREAGGVQGPARSGPGTSSEEAEVLSRRTLLGRILNREINDLGKQIFK